MFFGKVSSGSVIIFLTVFFPSLCFDSIQSEKSANHIEDLQAKPETKFKEFSTESPRFVFRRQHFNESMEKVQTLDNGAITKSAYIPLISDQFNISDAPHEENSDFPKNTSVNTKEPKDTEELRSQPTENIVVKNGKKYRIVKVKKTVKNAIVNQPLNQTRRSFKLIPSLSSILPLKWLTRSKNTEPQPEKRSKNATHWSKLTPIENPGENSKEILKYDVQNSEKIKKLLNLFTIVKFENGECYANGIMGTCIHQVECEAKGGKYAATCAENLGVCCYSEKTCGETSNDNCTYFINEGYPDSSTAAPKVCTLSLEKTSPQVKQFRLDFQLLQLREPTNGTCLHDRLVISGQDMNDVVPDICGLNTGQHIYVDVEDSSGPFNLNVITMGEYFPRNFRIKVSQITKDHPLLAPKNCLQYHVEPSGYVQTFNYQHDINADEEFSGYFNNLNYAVCIKKVRGFCSISYENEETDADQPTFQLLNVDEDGERLLPPRQAGVETFDCPDDYIIVNGIRLCGEKLNDASVEIDYTRNYPVTDTTNGPFVLSVRTDAAVSGRGFNLRYSQNPCFI